MKRIVLLALLCVLAPLAASAQGVRYDSIAFATRGVPLPNPTVSVSATVYTNSTLATAAANPLPIVAIGQTFTGAGVDASGNFGFWAPPGRYVLTISGSGVTTPITMTVTLPCDSTTGTSCSLSASSVTAASVTDSGLTAGNCVQATTGGQLTTSSGPCGTSSGTITATGSPASGNLAKFSGATSITNGDLSGDCTTSGALATICTKTSGTAFAPSATTDTTNAANISSGTLAGARMSVVNLAASGNGGVTGNLPVTNLNSGTSADSSHFWRGDGTWAVPTNTSAVFVGGCNGTASAGSTLTLFGLGNFSALTCTQTGVAGSIPMPSAGTLKNLRVVAVSGGVNASSGVVTVMINGASSGITCTLGTGTTCNDTTHAASVSAGDLVLIQFTTQGAETLAGVRATVEKQ